MTMTVAINSKHAAIVFVSFVLFNLALSDVNEGADIVAPKEENDIDGTIVEFKTQSPPDHLPEEPKNCYEYLYGKLSAIRMHGATWQNGGADCSNCTCDNGDIRCFFHFCNGPSMDYMTPPTTEDELILSPPSTEEDLTEDLISSGLRPREMDEDDEGTEDTTSSLDLKHEEGSKSESEEMLSDGDMEDQEREEEEDEDQEREREDQEEKDRTENETHRVYKTYFCDKTCKKSCPQGFKVDRVAGCWKCQCNKCPTLLTCKTKCPLGYAVDFKGCETCSCSIPSESNSEDIVFTDDYNEVLHHLNNDIDNTLSLVEDYAFERSAAEDEVGSNSSVISDSVDEEVESSSSSSSEEYEDDTEEEGFENSEGGEGDENEDGGEEKSVEETNAEEFISKNIKETTERNEQNENRYENKADEEDEEGKEEEEREEERGTLSPLKISTLSKGRRVPHMLRLTPEDVELTSYPSIRDENKNTGNEPCNNTEIRGCLDGLRKFPVGGSWSRGPCVTCRCMAPGYSECNITQCHGLYHCPQDRRVVPPEACCPICKEDSPSTVYAERAHDSRSTSRVPTDLLPLKHQNDLLREEEPEEDNEEATITSIPKDEQPHLLSILIPMGIICCMGAFLFVVLWRRYHSDKYDINSYRPEEKQKLRPVKTLSDDNSLIGHVC